MADMPKTTPHARPLSPHLSIWKPKITMVMSILHRITGAALYFGTLILAWWLVAAASGATYFTMVNDLLSSIPGRLVLFGYTWVLFHHMMGGIRHLVWDTGRGLDVPSANLWGWLSVIISAGRTIGLWVVAYAVA